MIYRVTLSEMLEQLQSYAALFLNASSDLTRQHLPID